jgi:4a-hydroxytetrahydrobiopterin dehydratase
MSDLSEGACVPCRGGVPPLTEAEAESLRAEVPGVARRHARRRRPDRACVRFPDFRSAMDFAVQVGELAEREQHHPDLHVSWGKVVVETWTHKIKGLHRNDFILAAKTDRIYERAARA